MRVAKDKITGSTSYLATASPLTLYVGGRPSDYITKGIDDMSQDSLLGCIKNLALNGVHAGEPAASFDVEPCTWYSDTEEPVVFQQFSIYDIMSYLACLGIYLL